MKALARRRSARWASGAICALVGLLLLTPAPARAGCGDYVTGGHPGGAADYSQPDMPATSSGNRAFAADRFEVGALTRAALLSPLGNTAAPAGPGYPQAPCRPCRGGPNVPGSPGPCPGPQCSGLPPALPLASAPVPVRPCSDWAWLPCRLPAADLPPVYSLSESPAPRLACLGAAVYRPPR
jgi:hypothetical protein